MHNAIFFTNVLRILGERGMTKHDLAKLTHVSISVISEITNGKGNPTLKTMTAIAEALQTPLPTLLESTDLDSKELDDAAGVHIPSSLPPGYCRICANLTDHQAFQVRKWHHQNLVKIREDGGLQREMEFEQKLRELLREYRFSLRNAVDLLAAKNKGSS